MYSRELEIKQSTDSHTFTLYLNLYLMKIVTFYFLVV